MLALAPAGCGYKGPLYLPEAKADARRSRAPLVLPEPAPERPVPAEAAPAPQVNPYVYQRGELHVEDVPLSRIAAEARHAVLRLFARGADRRVSRASAARFAGRDHLVCYAVKANSNLAILDLFARLGSGFDIVSGGELAARARGGRRSRRKVVFSGVGKSAAEIRAALEAGILCFNVESESELVRIDRIAGELGMRAPVSLRVNPDVDPGTHPYIATGLKQSKFGIAVRRRARAVRSGARASRTSRIEGIDCHIGSQLTEIEPDRRSARQDRRARGAAATRTASSSSTSTSAAASASATGTRAPPALDEYARAVMAAFPDPRHKLLFEPGRLLTGNGGVLLTRVEYLKRGEERNFADRRRRHERPRCGPRCTTRGTTCCRCAKAARTETYDVVGPVCETGDFIARDRRLAAREGDLLAIMSAGAYGMSMASNYNTRPRAAEVMVDGDAMHVIREPRRGERSHRTRASAAVVEVRAA